LKIGEPPSKFKKKVIIDRGIVPWGNCWKSIFKRSWK